MKILLTGAGGQVGYELERCLQGLGQVVAVGRAQMDLSDLAQVRAVVRAVRPQLIVNPAAYTQVDQAEQESELAWRVNAEAPRIMAQEARALGAAMVQFSTDYVFDGEKNGAYVESDLPNPLNAYGKSKLAGEEAVAAAGIPHLILRTSWVYGTRGRNFLLTMLKLASQQPRLRVVADQTGAPTWSRLVAQATAHLLVQARSDAWWQQHAGIYHVACAGQASWHAFAEAIMAEAGIDCQVDPIATVDYPTPARRPRNSLLSGEKLSRFCTMPEWRDALRLALN